jgi:predicted nucleic acid-binding Zn ribbon protein
MSGSNLTPGSAQRTTASADAVMKGHGFYNKHSRPQQKDSPATSAIRGSTGTLLGYGRRPW